MTVLPRHLAALLVLLAALAPNAAAQGFNSFNARNHPEIEWRVAETAHFKIMTPAHLPGLADEAAAIAEETYDSLSETLGVTFGVRADGTEDRGDKLRIYLSDEDEITNGFAAPVGVGYTAIWVHVNEVAIRWTGREKWLRTVLAHELAHLFHFRAVGANPYSIIAGDPLPRFFTEGLAQYLTETWNPYRGERWLRTATLDDRLGYEDGRSARNGALLYAVGNSQVRMLAETYGDTTLAALLARREPGPLGIGRVHDFSEAFQETYGLSYEAFREDWRRRVNITYNEVAAQMEPVSALAPHVLPAADSTTKAEARARGERIGMPGQYVYDVQISPDGERMAAVVLTSLARPVRRLVVMERAPGSSTETWRSPRVVAEGGIGEQIAWHPDGQRLAYARNVRGAYGSLVDDIFETDLRGRERRITKSRRASLPAYSPTGDRLAFVVSDGGRANVVIRDLASGEERAGTRFLGDVQIGGLRWHPSAERLALARFGPSGARDVGIVELEGRMRGGYQPLTGGLHDDHGPVWLPGGDALAFVSLRDGVPNVFAFDALEVDAPSGEVSASAAPRRITNVVTGADVRSVRADSALGAQLYVIAPESKTSDRVYRIPAARAPSVAASEIARPAWQTHQPPRPIPRVIPPDSSLIRSRYRYRSLANVTHAFSFGVPYYFGPDAYGLFATSTWFEPLGKHLFSGVAGLNFAGPLEDSFVALSYVNNQLRPSLTFSAYQLPGEVRPYGDDVLAERFVGGEVIATLPLETTRPYIGQRVSLRARYRDIAPLDLGDFDPGEAIPAPVSGQQADLTLAYTRRTQRPFAYNLVHPLDGSGVRVAVLGAANVLGGDSEFVRGDLAAFRVLPALGTQRLFVYARAQAQEGEVLPQNQLGFSKRDGLRIGLGVEAIGIPFVFGDTERVRGYTSTVLGDRLLFGSAEYRILLTPSLETEILGFVSFGATALAVFADAGVVWSGAGFDAREERYGLGAEVKNALTVGGLEIGHAVGFARPYFDWFEARTQNYDDWYYRIQAALPF